MGLSNRLKKEREALFFTNIYMCKKRHFYVKKLFFFYKLNGCKNTGFLQKYIFVKNVLFYVKSLFFYKDKVVKNQLSYRNIFL